MWTTADLTWAKLGGCGVGGGGQYLSSITASIDTAFNNWGASQCAPGAADPSLSLWNCLTSANTGLAEAEAPNGEGALLGT